MPIPNCDPETTWRVSARHANVLLIGLLIPCALGVPFRVAHGPPIQAPMRGSSTGSRPRQVLLGIGLATALLALLYLAFAVCMAIYAPGHWGDVLWIASLCLAAGVIAVALIRTGRGR